ncbi:MAG: acyltransferase family protein [Candidatus Levyibacteriota bacterium]
MKNVSKQSAFKRVSWIDICRGIGIIFVLYGHLLSSDSLRYLIYSFHMPLFFFLSGLVFKPVLLKPIQYIIIKNIKQLLLPYFGFALFTYIFAVVSNPAPDLSPGGIAWQLFGILYGSGNDGMLGFNVVLWFLPCLFITKLTFALITRKVIKLKLIGFLLLMSGILGYGLSVLLPWIKLPFGFEIALTSLVFFGMGYLWKERKFTLPYLRSYRVPLTLLAILITLLGATTNYHIYQYQTDLRINHLGNFFLFYLSAFSGIFGCLMVSQLITKNAFLEYLGRNSLVLFAWHNLLFVNLKEIMAAVASDDFINSVKLFLPTFYVLTVICIIHLSRKMLLLLKNASLTLFLTIQQ